MKRFIAGFMTGAVLFGAVGAFAASYVANSVDFKVLVNGKEFVSDPPALEVEGRTYLPLRAMGEALGVPVVWNDGLRQAEVGSAPIPEGNYSRTNPAPINTVQKIFYKDYSSEYNAAIRVIETLRGDAAWAKIKEANMFNKAAEEGYEYVLARIAVSMLSVTGDKAIAINEFSFDCYSGDNVKYEKPFVVEPKPPLSTDMFAGANTDGWITFAVKKTDAAPKIVFGQDYSGAGGIWFALQ